MTGKLGRVKTPVEVTCASGDTLVVDYRLAGDGAEDVSLLGPAVHVFEGTVSHPVSDCITGKK